MMITRLSISKNKLSPPLPDLNEKIYETLVLGVKDYVTKNHAPGIILGLSGGIDSALSLAIAVDALGADRVEAILMPSRYTADLSVTEASMMAKNLGVKYQINKIRPAFDGFIETLELPYDESNPNITVQNIQARCRATMLMALSNQTGKLVLTTGNRSELAVGYTTLYGDMAGAFCVLKDVPKTLVYQLSNYRNSITRPNQINQTNQLNQADKNNQTNLVIPQAIIDRPPSAELAHGQADQDTLPSYEILDKILELYLNQEKSLIEIVDKNFDYETVKWVVDKIRLNEYKRKQAPPGVRLNLKAFGRDRRYPITSGYVES